MNKKKKINKYFLWFVSIVTSISIWSYVAATKRVKYDLVKKVRINLPEGHGFEEHYLDEVYVSIEGTRLDLAKVRNKEFDLLYNIKIKNSHVSLVRIVDSDLKMPKGVQVLSVSPRIIQAKYGKLVEKKIKINPVLKNKISGTFTLKEFKLLNEKVLVKGTKNVLKTLNSIETENIDFTHYIGAGKGKALLLNDDSRLVLTKKSVDFSYNVTPTKSNLILKDIPIFRLDQNGKESDTLKTADIFILANENHKDELSFKDLKVIETSKSNAKGKKIFNYDVHLPSDVHLIEIRTK